MEYQDQNKYQEFGRVDSFNLSDGITNMSITLEDNTQINIKVLNETDLEIGKVYLFSFICKYNGTRNQLILLEYKDIFKCDLSDKVYDVLKKFYHYVNIGIKPLEDKLDKYINMIENETIKKIVCDIFSRYKHDFLLYPAASKMHHNYIGGLAYHTLTMCDLAKAFNGIYESIDLDYLIAGALLHDISKIIEFSYPADAQYSVKGQLLGHLVMGAMEIDATAKRLGLDDKEEVMLLEHMLISHHGNPQFGACKKPETPEALLLWLIDTIDSKMRVIDETFRNLDAGSFSEALGVLDRMKVYKKQN